MKKYFLGFLLVACVAAFIPSVKADAQTIVMGDSEDWNVTYDGKKVEHHNIDGDAIADTIGKQAQPGDIVDYVIDYKNTASKDEADWYLSTSVISSLEENSKASGGAYDFVLSYDLNGKKEELYNSSTIGGNEQGLKQLGLDGKYYFYIGRTANNQVGTINLEIKLDGQTVNNDYMRQLAQLMVKFGAVTVPSGTPETIFVPGKDHEHINYVPGKVIRIPNGTTIVEIPDGDIPMSGPTPNGPRTGDDIRLLIICAVGLMLGISLIVWYFVLLKKRQQQEA